MSNYDWFNYDGPSAPVETVESLAVRLTKLEAVVAKLVEKVYPPVTVTTTTSTNTSQLLTYDQKVREMNEKFAGLQAEYDSLVEENERLKNELADAETDRDYWQAESENDDELVDANAELERLRCVVEEIKTVLD